MAGLGWLGLCLPEALGGSGLGAGEAPRRELTETDVAAIVDGEIADLRASADDYDRLGRHDRASGLRAGCAVTRATSTPAPRTTPRS